jgi:hypothetical protein
MRVAGRVWGGDVAPLLVKLTATRVQPGAILLIEVSRRRWSAAGFSWDRAPLVRPAIGHSQATRTVVKRVERESTVFSGGTRTEIIVWTSHGVLVCAPSTVLHILKVE